MLQARGGPDGSQLATKPDKKLQGFHYHLVIKTRTEHSLLVYRRKPGSRSCGTTSIQTSITEQAELDIGIMAAILVRIKESSPAQRVPISSPTPRKRSRKV